MRDWILLIEDDQDIREQLTGILSFEGYAVRAVPNGHSGLELLGSLEKSEFPGCVLLDLMMPAMNGPAFLDQLKLDIPIIIITARPLHAGPIINDPRIVTWVTKPFDLDKLFSALASILIKA